jgi:hypothetical protein
MSCNGIHTHYEHFKKLKEEKKQEADKLLSDILNEFGDKYTKKIYNSPKQLKQLFYEDLKVKPYKTKNKITINEAALKKIKIERNKASLIANNILTIKKIKKFLKDNEKEIVDCDNKLRPSYNPVNINGSRITSSKNIFGTGYDLEKIDNSIFSPEKDNILIFIKLYNPEKMIKKCIKILKDDYLFYVKSQIEENRYVRNLTGRRVFLTGDYCDFKMREGIYKYGYEYLIKSTIADYIKILINKIYYSRTYEDFDLVATYDNIIILQTNSSLWYGLDEIRNVLESSIKFDMKEILSVNNEIYFDLPRDIWFDDGTAKWQTED